MNYRKLQDRIEDINKRYPNINYGGCGIFSYYLHKTLRKKYNIDSEVVYIKSDNPPGLKPDYDIKFRHILVKTDEYYIDNNGFYTKLDDIERLSIEKLEEMISIKELWNNKFSSSKSELTKELLNL